MKTLLSLTYREGVSIDATQNLFENDDEDLTVFGKIRRYFSEFSLKGVIPYNSNFRKYWDLSIIAFSLWVCFMTPFDIAFEPLTFKYKNLVALN
jgi:hypothetical protein